MAKGELGKQPLTEDRKKDVWYLRRLCDASINGDIEIITSTLVIAECLHVGDGFIDETVRDLFEKYLTSGRIVKPVDAGYFIAIDARDLYWKRQILLSGADAVHVATALKTNCLEFITTDDKINKKSKFTAAIPLIESAGLRVIRGSETRLLPSQYRQGELR
jgi:predicted nucleic acid-binding protein